MGVEIWISYSDNAEEFFIQEAPSRLASGPIEISNELYERIMEHEREHRVIQDILESLDYEWTFPDD